MNPRSCTLPGQIPIWYSCRRRFFLILVNRREERDWKKEKKPYSPHMMLDYRRRSGFFQPRPSLGINIQEPRKTKSRPSRIPTNYLSCIKRKERVEICGEGPEDGAKKTAGLVGPEVGGITVAFAAAGAGAGAAAPVPRSGVGVVVVVEGLDLVDLGLAEGQGQQRPRRVPLGRVQRRERHHAR